MHQQLNNVILEGTVIELVTRITDFAGRKRSVLLLRYSNADARQMDEFFVVLCDHEDAERLLSTHAQVMLIGSLCQISLDGRSVVAIEADYIEGRLQPSLMYASERLP